MTTKPKLVERPAFDFVLEGAKRLGRYASSLNAISMDAPRVAEPWASPSRGSTIDLSRNGQANEGRHNEAFARPELMLKGTCIADVDSAPREILLERLQLRFCVVT